MVAGRLGVKFTAAPKLSLAEGLDATRRLFPRLKFDQRQCGRLLEAVSEYRRTWDPERKLHSDKPLHNWCSHFVDALRTFAVAYRDRDNDDRPRGKSYIAKHEFNVLGGPRGAEPLKNPFPRRPS